MGHDSAVAEKMLEIWDEQGWWNGKEPRGGEDATVSEVPVCLAECYQMAWNRISEAERHQNDGNIYDRLLVIANELFSRPLGEGAPIWLSVPSFNDSHTEEDVRLVVKHLMAAGE